MIVLVQSPGRLGNKLWTLANVLAFCIENGTGFVHADMHGLPPLSGSILAGYCKHSESALYRAWLKLARKARLHDSLTIRPREYVDLDQSTELKALIRKRRVVQLAGYYLAAPESLTKHRDKVVKVLQFDSEIQSRAVNIKTASFRKDGLNIAIHMRRGDYRQFIGGMLCYSDDTYRSVAGLVQAASDRPVRFHLFSDEAIPEAAFSGLDIVAHHGNVPELDLAIMASCDAIVGPSSSFSQWASFIGDVPIHVLEPETVSRLSSLSTLPEPGFSVFGPRRFGEKAAVRLTANRALVPALT